MIHLSKPMLGTQIDWGNPLTKGLVACYMFNEGQGNKIQDLSGNGNVGTLKNMAFPPVIASGWNPNRSGMGLNFDGTDDYVDCGTNSILNQTSYTLSVRFRTSGTSPNDTAGHRLIFIERALQSSRITLMLRNNVAQMLWVTPALGAVELSTGVVVNDGKWHNFVGTTDGTIFKVSLDGILKNTSAASSMVNLFYRMNFGFPTGGGNYYNGIIDEVRIWKRVLIDNEILSLYTNPYGMFK